MICSSSSQQLERIQEILKEQYSELIPHCELVKADLVQGFLDKWNRVYCFSERQIFNRPKGTSLVKKGIKRSLTKKQLARMEVGDYVTHVDYGIGRFAGLDLIKLRSGNQQEVMRIIYKSGDCLSVGLQSLHKISKYESNQITPPNLSSLGTAEWENKKRKVKSRLEKMARTLMELYAKRKDLKGSACSKDTYLMAELESSFEFEETPDQYQAIQDVKKDMESEMPMDRLICGDVGFGKTEIAVRAALKAVISGKQVCLLVPTTILCYQHYQTFTKRLQHFPCNIDFVNRFRTTKEINSIIKKVGLGDIDILIGTHKIIHKRFIYKDLGLLVVDEEQKFGVKVKEEIKEMSSQIDVLTLTATPIPRTLQFSLLGVRDLSTLHTPPKNRQPIQTILYSFQREVIQKAIYKELDRSGQVFFVHNKIHDMEAIADLIRQICPEARLTTAHGQLKGDLLENKILDFVHHKYDVLLSTNIVESGLDISNVNTIIINEAHRFGLADLHQLRGRVGRSHTKGYCYMLIPPKLSLSIKMRRRLQTLEDFTDLGDGFKIAMRDLDIRGTGNLFGYEQSGFINELGYETYNRILYDVIDELKLSGKDLENSKKITGDMRKTHCVIETDFDLMIPPSYIESTTERLELYWRIDACRDLEALQKIESELKDRFGKLPKEVERIFKMVQIRWQAEALSFEKVNLSNGKLKNYLSKDKAFYETEVFAKLLDFIQEYPEKMRLQQTSEQVIIVVQGIYTIEQLESCLGGMKV